MKKHNLNSKLPKSSQVKGNTNQLEIKALPFLGNAFVLVQGFLREELILEATINPADWKNKAFMEQLVSEALGCRVVGSKFLKYGY